MPLVLRIPNADMPIESVCPDSPVKPGEPADKFLYGENQNILFGAAAESYPRCFVALQSFLLAWMKCEPVTHAMDGFVLA